MTPELAAQLAVLLEVQDGICGLCFNPMEQRLRRRSREQNPMRPTVDHTIPRSLGGRDEWGNRVGAHSQCNNRKGSRWPTPEELAFLETVNARIPHLLRLAA